MATQAHETARQHTCTRIPIAQESETSQTILNRLNSDGYDLVELVAVNDASGRYRGVIPIQRLIEAGKDEAAATLIAKSWPTVDPAVDQEHAVDIAANAAVSALPVVLDGRVLGIIPALALLEVLAREHREDMNRIVGVLKERSGARHALEDPPLQRVARRLPWLLVGLALSSASALVMAGFERTLEANVTIAFFIPALVYLADAVGTQTEAIAVRGLSVRRQPLRSILMGELLTGGLIGLVLGLFAFAGCWAALGNMRLGLAVGVSLLAAASIASLIGLALPWLLGRAGIDPAFGSGPVATIIQDVLTIVIYFAVVTALLPAPGG